MIKQAKSQRQRRKHPHLHPKKKRKMLVWAASLTDSTSDKQSSTINPFPNLLIIFLSSPPALLHYNRFLMGQVNCHCQYISSDDFQSFKNHSSKLPALTQEAEIAQIYTKIVLKNTQRNIEIPLSETNKFTFGTTEDCQKRPEHFNGNSFKLSLRFSNRCAYIKDCGVGLGVFLMKRKLTKRAGHSNILLNIAEKWIVLKITQAEQVNFCIYDGEKSEAGVLQKSEEHEIDLGNEKIVLKRDREGREYTIRRSDRREMWILLGEQKRVKSKDILRLGFEFYEVESISSYLEASKILRKY